MKLYLRTQQPNPLATLAYDACVEVASKSAWRDALRDAGPTLISSLLLPDTPTFALQGKHLHTRSHHHETHYVPSATVNASYRDAAAKLAQHVLTHVGHAQRVLVYLPLRGALPIWRAIKRYLPASTRWIEHYPVTSSFVTYPDSYGYRGKNGGRASGRYTNILELRRLQAGLLAVQRIDHFLYVDEMISGGMMRGHVNEMLDLRLHEQVPITVLGMADAFGTRCKAFGYLQGLVTQGKLHAFAWEGCEVLITEDQKFLLGIHFVDHALGPHVVPVQTPEGDWFPEKHAFDVDVFGAVGSGFEAY